MGASLTFLGAAGTVTGAKFLVETAAASLLLECGMFQGVRELRQRNWAPLPLDPRALSAVLLSHAHIDHSGYLPRLVRDGFAGPVYCSPGTADLLRIMLPDAARLQEEEAEYRNRKGATRFGPALPLFSVEDAERVLGVVRPVPFERRFVPAPGGEATYGNRRHPSDDGTPVIVRAVARAVEQRGWLLVPAFAVGRTQDLLYLLRSLEAEGRIPRLAVYLDSPMGIEATAVYARHHEEHDAEMTRLEAQGNRPFGTARLHVLRTTAESKRLNDLDGPVIVIAGSGMATGGRVLHHLRHRLPDPRTTVLFVGYQAAGTRGRLLLDGARELRIFGEAVPVRATLMATDALSAHADQAEILRWLRGFARPPAKTWVVHGEPDAAAALNDVIGRELGWPCAVAADGQRVEI